MIDKKVAYTIHILTLVLVVASYVLNLGWYRVIFAIVFVPYFVWYGVAGWVFIKYHEKSPKILLLTILSLLSYAGLNLSLVDFSDVPPAYACFGMIHIDTDSSNIMLVFAVFVALHIALVLAQIATAIVTILRIRKAITVKGA